MQEFKDSFIEVLKNSPDLTNQIMETVGLLLTVWLLRFITLRVVNRRIENKKLLYKWRKNLTYISFFLSFVFLIQIWFSGVESIATFLGLLSAGIAIALKDPVTDLAAWLFVIWRRPFDVGDRLQIAEIRGDVIDIRPFKFTLLEIGNWVDADQSTGRVIHVPNHKIFTENIANYTSDFEFIWNELRVLITFESDWKKAKNILREIVNNETSDFVEKAKHQLKKAAKSYLIEFRYLTPIIYTDVKDSGINLTVRYLTDPRMRRSTGQAIWENILEQFGNEDSIDFAYPTLRVYDNPREGKPGTIPNPPHEV